ncbi:transglutaminase family protein [Blastococcus haudaquaticus]|uniref:Transglutaminase-like enzyme, putative cysteine protease n=1 Tax=Blastococcus haudaquaticus TaxID=1938745 RepID=A0A286GZQ8_9ACTN|nr:transglutaminase family protein [Blastococcus haudaquaticus]SOE00544.1 Transglutaminase-like enzyme, putative cysteine protease [Blastococcus haudaquaticus]
MTQSQAQSQVAHSRPAAHRWRLQVVHRTRFHYTGQVRSSYNEARLTPESSNRQTTLRSKVEIEPAATAYAYRDYWGSTVTAFDLHSPHSELVVTGTSIVEAGPDLGGHDRVGWSSLAAGEVRAQFGELLSPTPLTAMDDEVVAEARAAVGDARPQQAGRVICEFVRDRIGYLSGSTNVKTNAMQAWSAGQGVCQDISHVTVGLLRALGLPARYVSGYLHPRPGAEIGVPVTGESHAWVEWWDGGWNAYDPTNAVEIGTRHVTLGRGRDYGDVPPFKGLFSGPKSEGHTVTVEVTRLA